MVTGASFGPRDGPSAATWMRGCGQVDLEVRLLLELGRPPPASAPCRCWFTSAWPMRSFSESKVASGGICPPHFSRSKNCRSWASVGCGTGVLLDALADVVLLGHAGLRRLGLDDALDRHLLEGLLAGLVHLVLEVARSAAGPPSPARPR